MPIGFGKTEEQTAINICKEIIRIVREHQPVQDEDKLKKAFKNFMEEYNKSAKKYNNLPSDEVPQRYTEIIYITLHNIYSQKQIIKLSLCQINRQHPFSPDGTAAIFPEWIIIVTDDKKKIYKQYGY